MYIEDIKTNFLEQIKNVKTLDDVKNLKIEFLGKKSKINDIMKTMSTLSIEEKKTIGAEVNVLKNFISE